MCCRLFIGQSPIKDPSSADLQKLNKSQYQISGKSPKVLRLSFHSFQQSRLRLVCYIFTIQHNTAVPPMASQRWHVLGAGALGSLWIARLARAASGRRTRPTLILKDETWSKLGRPSTCSVTVDERHRGGVARNSHSWLAETSVQPLSAEDPIERLLVRKPGAFRTFGFCLLDISTSLCTM